MPPISSVDRMVPTPAAAPPIPLTVATALLALGLAVLAGGAALALRPGTDAPSAFDAADALLSPAALLRLALLGAVALAVGLLGALVDLRTRRGTRDLAGVHGLARRPDREGRHDAVLAHEQHVPHDAEHRDRRADPEREGAGRQNAERALAREHAQGKADIG